MKALWHAAWGIALVWALVADYTDKNLPGHDQFVYGAHVYAADPGDLALLVLGGLGFWFGMRALRGRL